MPWARGGGFVTVDGESDREFDETFAEDAALVSSLTSPLLTSRGTAAGSRGRRLPPAGLGPGQTGGRLGNSVLTRSRGRAVETRRIRIQRLNVVVLSNSPVAT